jgi:mono/diheme cytochrome c family protein
MDAMITLASGEASFFDETFLYISGGALVLFALVVAFLGIKKEDFPTGGQFRALTGIAVVLVVCTGIGAVESARFEQSERRAENEEAAKEAQAEEVEKEQEEAPLGEGQAAEPGDASGEASGVGQGPAEADIDGAGLFVDTGCGGCHTLADAGTNGQIGPDLDEVLPGMDPKEIRTSIVDPGAEVTEGFGDGIMPTTYGDELTEAQLDGLAAYLAEVAGS